MLLHLSSLQPLELQNLTLAVTQNYNQLQQDLGLIECQDDHLILARFMPAHHLSF